MYKPFNTCLLIDDSAFDNFIHTKILKRNNFAAEIIVTQYPKEALLNLKTEVVRPDVIFLDIRMPEMNGFQFLDEFDKLAINKSGIKIFMLSSSIDPADITKSKANKYVTTFLQKTLTSEILERLKLY